MFLYANRYTTAIQPLLRTSADIPLAAPYSYFTLTIGRNGDTLHNAGKDRLLYKDFATFFTKGPSK